MNTRLKQFLSAENITQAQFADTIEVVRASVSHVLSGRNNPSYDFIKAIMQHYPHLNIEWLIFGKGRMYKEKGYNDLFTEPDMAMQAPEVQTQATTDTLPDTLFEPEEPAPAGNERTDRVTFAQGGRKVSKIIILFDDGTYQEM